MPNTACSSTLKAAVHGLAVEMRCEVPALAPELQRLFVDFTVPEWPEGFTPVRGSIVPFSAEAVSRSLPGSAVNISPPDELIELYRDGDRFWVVDDRWGMAELHLLRKEWRSWILPHPKADPTRCAEMAILWPLAQLLRLRGLTLIPAVSVAKHGWAALILCPFGIEPELRQLLLHGYKIVGQRWTALREEENQISLLRMPGRVEQLVRPHRCSTARMPALALIDLADEFPHQTLHQTFCDAVLLVPPGRRATAANRSIAPSKSLGLLRRSWPMIDLPVGPRGAQIPIKLSQSCPVHELHLSRNPLDLLQQVESLRNGAVKSVVKKSKERRPAVPAF